MITGHCEDFPCCGHESGSCPTQRADGSLVYRCSEGCGRKLPRNATSSICRICLRRLQTLWSNGGERY